ncbi:uncharacterized protein PV09_09726 [Verruconis gallopava]|uniref:Uncharacterized protein n=1 Tax=Verruconis gallopava TaxID=253628 RepID=A0A0D1X8V0_9PEZI|nr:uncharacterized protein PV09_09726 [Verruconis gallopava]KIV98460.1 hypothetical protein PV09_09726 [Verruconis gallopava]
MCSHISLRDILSSIRLSARKLRPHVDAATQPTQLNQLHEDNTSTTRHFDTDALPAYSEEDQAPPAEYAWIDIPAHMKGNQKHFHTILLLTEEEKSRYVFQCGGNHVDHEDACKLYISAQLGFQMFASLILLFLGSASWECLQRPIQLKLQLWNSFLTLDPSAATALAGMTCVTGILQKDSLDFQVVQYYMPLLENVMDGLSEESWHGDTVKVSDRSEIYRTVQRALNDKHMAVCVRYGGDLKKDLQIAVDVAMGSAAQMRTQAEMPNPAVPMSLN